MAKEETVVAGTIFGLDPKNSVSSILTFTSLSFIYSTTVVLRDFLVFPLMRALLSSTFDGESRTGLI